MIIFLLLLPALTSGSFSTNDQKEPDINVSGSRADVQWSGVVVIESDTTIPSGQVLEVAPYTQVYVKADTGIYIEGTLKVNGQVGAEVSFGALGGSGLWDGITFKDNANTFFSYIRHCEIADAKTALSYRTGNIVLDGVGLSNNGVALKPYLATGTINNTSFVANDIAIYGDTGTVRFTGCTMTNSVSYDVILDNDSQVEFNNVTFNKNKIRIDDIYSELTINHFLKISISDPVHADRYSADIEIHDFHGSHVSSITVVPGTTSDWIQCRSFSYTTRPLQPGSIKINYFTSHQLKIERFNAVRNHLVYLDSNKHVTIDWTALSTGLEAAGKSVSIRDQEAFMHDFINLGWKHTARPEKVYAANYLASRMSRLGDFKIEFSNQSHPNLPIDNGSFMDVIATNVVCTLEGTNGDNDRYIAITAHYDTDHNVNVVGADDDGSGVTALLEIARIIGHLKFNTTIKFIFFDTEEEGYIGSYDYVNKANSSGHDIILDINLDMIGYNQNKSYPCIIRTNPESLSYANMFSNLEGQYDFGLDVKVVNDASYRRSDYFRFWDYGFKAINFVEAEVVEAWNPYYHKTTDTYDKINFTYLSRMTGLAAAGLMKLAEPQNLPPTDPAGLGPASTHLLRPTVTWQPSVDQNGDSISYHLEVFDPSSIRIVNKIVTTNSYTFGANLSFGETYQMKVTASDPSGGSSSTITADMSVINTAPALAAIPDQNLTQDQPWSLKLTATDTDIPSDVLEFTANTTLFQVGRYTGNVSWTPTKYEVGIHMVTFTVFDGNNANDSQSVIINVANVNDPPDVLATPKTITIDEDTIIINAFNFNEIFTDADHDELTFKVINASHIDFIINSNGSVDIIPLKNWFGTEPVELLASDPYGANSSVILEVIVSPVNDAPVLEHIADVLLNE
jgi:hypothetical protein